MYYEGMFSEGSKHKFGKLKWKETGNYYEGEFYENDIYGNGYMIWVDNYEKYIGKWKCNQQNGMGVHIWYEPKGESKYLKNRYVGEWEEGQRQGYGVFFYANGSKYEGLWDISSRSRRKPYNSDRRKSYCHCVNDKACDAPCSAGDTGL